MTKIEWTQRTWNPIAGCSVVSPGCTNCYAMRQARRLGANPKTPHYAGTTQTSRGGPVWTGRIGVAGDRAFLAPLRRRAPTVYFVNSMSDLFHEAVPDEVIDRVFAVMALCPQHTFQVLTKRSWRMREYLKPTPRPHGTCMQDRIWRNHHAAKHSSPGHQKMIPNWPLPNVWLGVSAEDQTRADERIPDLLDTPAAVRFVSAEPLLGPISFEWLAHEGDGVIDALRGEDWVEADGPVADVRLHGQLDLVHLRREVIAHRPAKLDWIIAGGESGRGARPMHPDWARSLRDQCQSAGTAFFFKQWGEWGPGFGPEQHRFDDGTCVARVGKKRTGRTLQGRTWDEVPG